jgi:hypothetical protein
VTRAPSATDRSTPAEDVGWTVVARVGVIVLAVAFPVSTLVTFGFYPGGYYDHLVPGWQVVTAWVLLGIFVPIQLAHVRHGLRDEAPPHGLLTFAVMLATMVVGELVLGHVWTHMFASLIASALLVFRPPWSVVWAVGVTVACYPLGTGIFGEGGWYVTVVVAFRSTTLFTLVWLVNGVHRLRAAREALAQRATARERARVDAELLSSLRGELERIEAEARRAGAELASGHDSTTRRALAQVTGDSRSALAAARSVVADMRRASSREDLQAAARLLAVPDGGRP